MSTKGQIEDAVQQWLAASAADGGAPSSDIRSADQGSVQSLRPSASIRVESYDDVVGTDEVLQSTHPTTGDPLYVVRGWRTATVVVTTAGAGAEGWIRRACARLSLPSVRLQLQDLGFDIEPISPILNFSGVERTHPEERAQREFRVSYVQTSTLDEADPLTELGTVEAALELQDDDGAPVLAETETITL